MNLEIMNQEMGFLATFIVATMVLIGRVKIGGDKAVHRINRSWWWQRFGTLFALVLGIAGAFIPGIVAAETTPGQKIVFGVIGSSLAIAGRSALKENLFRMLEDKR